MADFLSLIVPVYNEEASLQKLFSEMLKSIENLEKKNLISGYEILMIDDGSTDDSEKIILKAAAKNQAIKLVSLRRNFGKSRALQIGFEYAKGDIIITLDADLQDDPKEFERFIRKINDGFDLVSGWKKKRLDPMEKRLPSKFFNFITSLFSGVSLHDFNCGFKAYRREVIKNINVYGEFHRYIPVLAKKYGFKITEISVLHHKRQYGVSKFGFERYLRGFFDAFSVLFLQRYYDKPMYFFGMLGFVFGFWGFVICAYLTLLWLMGEAIGHRPLLFMGVLFILVGVQFFSMGLIGNMITDANERKQPKDAFVKKTVLGEKHEKK